MAPELQEKSPEDIEFCNFVTRLGEGIFRFVYREDGLILSMSSMAKMFIFATDVIGKEQDQRQDRQDLFYGMNVKDFFLDSSEKLFPDDSNDFYGKITINNKNYLTKSRILRHVQNTYTYFILSSSMEMVAERVVGEEHDCMYKTIVDQTPILIWTLRPDGQAAYLNDTFRTIVGIQEDGERVDDEENKPDNYRLYLNWNDVLHPDDVDKVLFSLSRLFAGTINNFESELRMKSQRKVSIEENYRWYNCKATKSKGFVFGCTTDVHDKVILEKQMRELAVEEASTVSALKLKRDFISLMSHEMRTPLSAISGMASFLQASDLNDQQNEYVSTISNSVEILTSTINDILEFSSLETNDIRLRTDIFDLDVIFNEISSLLRTMAKKKNTEIIIEKKGNFHHVRYGDKERLKQIFVNIVGNAVKFTSEGQVYVTIEGDDNESDIINFMIKDTGIGMHTRVENVLYNAFMQGDISLSRKYGGLGLGLYICKKLIDLMNGIIGIESEEGQGTTITISIPLPLPDVTNDKLNNPLEKKSEELTEELMKELKTKLTILYAEDNQVNQIIMKKYLTKLGYTNLKIVDDGLVAVEDYDIGKYHVILLDQSMPRMNGDDVCKYIRDRDGEQILISVSANIIIKELARFSDLGMNDYLTKPLSLSDLDLKLSKWVRYLYQKGKLK